MKSSGLLGARALRELLDSRTIRPKKRYGQNFVVDPNTIRKVLDVAALDANAHVLEIGAGVGSLTVGLASVAARVTAVEIDDRLLPLLEDTVREHENVAVLHADVMAMDVEAVEADSVVANLPYNLAASIVLKVLTDAPSVRSLTVMAQREVGERLVASPGSKIYGQTSVLVAFYASARLAGAVSRRAFYPVPDVDSVLVRIQRRSEPDVDPSSFQHVVRAAFSQRRKTLRNALASLSADGSVFEGAGVSPDERAESLSLSDFVALTRAWER
jgi:16S rRNA (adenine1518-N6/adenine1519-N6)-dimethyltransferase